MMRSFEQVCDQVAASLRRVNPIRLAVAGSMVAMLLMMMADGEVIGLVLVLTIGIGLLYLWGREFLALMQVPDDAFPGRFDKLAWAMAILLVPPIGVPAFWSFRRSRWAEADARTKPSPRPWLHEEL